MGSVGLVRPKYYSILSEDSNLVGPLQLLSIGVGGFLRTRSWIEFAGIVFSGKSSEGVKMVRSYVACQVFF